VPSEWHLLRSLERSAVAEQVASTLRHDMRNKFASIRNATFYIKKSLAKRDMLDGDARVPKFLDLINEQLEKADELLKEHAQHGDKLTTSSTPTTVDACVERAASKFPSNGPRMNLELGCGETRDLDSLGLTFAISCLIENAIEACGDEGEVFVSSERGDGGTWIHVKDSANAFGLSAVEEALTPFVSTKEGHTGIGLNLAARSMSLLGGRLELPSAEVTHPRLFISDEPSSPSL